MIMEMFLDFNWSFKKSISSKISDIESFIKYTKQFKKWAFGGKIWCRRKNIIFIFTHSVENQSAGLKLV